MSPLERLSICPVQLTAASKTVCLFARLSKSRKMANWPRYVREDQWPPRNQHSDFLKLLPPALRSRTGILTSITRPGLFRFLRANSRKERRTGLSC